MAVKAGDLVKVEYTGTLEDGTVFDSTENHDDPLEFLAGSGMLIKGFDDAVIDMEAGEEKTITVNPEDGYGEFLEELVRDFPKDGIPDSEQLAEGVTLIIGLPNGMQIAGRVLEIGDENVKIDMNHPLAGKVLTFNIKVLEFGEPSEEYLQQLAAQQQHGCGCGCEEPPDEEVHEHGPDCGHEHGPDCGHDHG